MYRCPQCQSTKLKVVVNTWAVLEQVDGRLATATSIDTDTIDWGRESQMECFECNFFGKARDFAVSKGTQRVVIEMTVDQARESSDDDECFDLYNYLLNEFEAHHIKARLVDVSEEKSV